MNYTIFTIKKQILDMISQTLDQEFDFNKMEITVPPDSTMGDLAVPCFYLSKLTRQAPTKIAQQLAEQMGSGGVISSLKNEGPYLNIFINPEAIGSSVIKEIQQMKSDYGQLKLSQEKVMLEFSQPNTHKEFHVGHSRNAILGQSLVNLLSLVGYKVIPVNYIGDVGAHVAKCLWALDKFHATEDYPDNKGKFLGQVYTEASQKIEANPDYKKEADDILKKLEAGDKKWTSLWKKTRDWSLKNFDSIYKILGIEFDHIFYESEVEKPGKQIVADLLEKGIAEKSQGAVIIDLDKYNLKQFLLLKSDGSSLYSTKELALGKLKFDKFKIDRSIVLVDNRQSFYMQQFFQTMKVIGFDKPMTHLSYEFVTLKDGAMASRDGNVVLFSDFYNQVVERSYIETKKRHEDWSDKKLSEVARKIALSAIKFNMLRVGNNNIIVFNIDEAISFEGFSGPYIQYTISRISSVIKKAGVRISTDINYGKLSTAIEKELLLKLASFPEVIADASTRYSPSEIAKYLFELSRLFSTFYQQSPIIDSPNDIRKARLVLADSVKRVLINGLNVLGIEPLDQM